MPPSDTQHILDALSALDAKLSATLSRLEASLMALSQAMAAFQAAVTPELARINTTIKDLQDKLASGTLTPDDVAFLSKFAQDLAAVGK